MNQQAPKVTPAMMPKRTQPTPSARPKRARKQAVQRLRDKRDDNIARSSAPARPLHQRIGDLFPELKSL